MSAQRMPNVEQALSWAYQAGCVYALFAAREYCTAVGLDLCLRDHGTYGYSLHYGVIPAGAQAWEYRPLEDS